MSLRMYCTGNEFLHNIEPNNFECLYSPVTRYILKRGSAVAECLTRDRGAAGLSLTGVTAFCP